MSEIQRTGGAVPANATAATQAQAPASAAGETRQSGPAAAADSDQQTTEANQQSGRTRQNADRARVSQERVARLQDERQQLRAERSELSGRGEARAERRGENRAERGEQTDRGERQAERQRLREERRAARATAQQGGENQAPTEPAATGGTTPTPATETPTPAPEAPEPTTPATEAPVVETPTQAPATTPAPEAPEPVAETPQAPTAATQTTVTQTTVTQTTVTQTTVTQTGAGGGGAGSGITITGSVRDTGGEAAENRVAVEGSNVAGERGVAGVRIDDPDEGATFRFEDLGNGQVRATRYETVDGEEVAAGSQTVAINGAGDSTNRGGAPGTLDFDQIGLELELDSDYTPGDLQFVEFSSGASDADQVAAGSFAQDAAPQATQETASAEAVRQQALAALESREQEIELSLSAEESALLNLVERLAQDANEATGSALRSADAAEDRDATLRIMAETLSAQGSPPGDRVLQLLS